MAHTCSECERSFVEETLLANHQNTVHADTAVAVNSLSSYIGQRPSDYPAYLGSMYAFDTTAPERRRVVKITGDATSGYVSEVVSDYKVIDSVLDEIKQVSDKLAGVKQVGRPDDIADGDDPPEQQALLMQAWQAMALYLANADDTDTEPAMQILKMVSNLMSGPGTNVDQPAAAGSFGLTSRASLDVAETTYDCPQCSRDFASEQGLINHLKNIHAAREKQTTNKTESD